MTVARGKLLTTFRGVSRCRLYATQAAAAGKQVEQRVTPTPQDAKISRLPNGISVVSLENYSPVSQIAVVYNAGPRHEPANKLGLTHCIRAASTLSTKNATAFNVAKNLQQIGATLGCTTTREHTIYALSCLRSDIKTASEFLGNVAVSPAFKYHELERINRRLRLDLELLNQSPSARLVEVMHQAAFRDTLGRSIYMSPDSIGSFTQEDMEAFTSTHYVSGNMAVCGLGMDHDTLRSVAEKLPVRQGAAVASGQKAKYYGGEVRVDLKGKLVHAALVCEGASWTSNDISAVALLRAALDSSMWVQYGSGTATSRLSKAAATATTGDFAVNCISSSYWDSGLFGVQLVANAQDAGKVLKAVAGAMSQVTKSGITEEEFKRAKAQVRSYLYDQANCPFSAVESMGTEVLHAGKVFSAAEIDAGLNDVTLDAVNNVAKRVITGRPTLAVVGDLVNTPYLDELL